MGRYVSSVSVMCCGAYRHCQIKSGRFYYDVVFDFGLSVKVNPSGRLNGHTVAGNEKMVALKAAECIESLSNRRLQPLLDHIQKIGYSTQEKKWICKRFEISEDEFKSRFLRSDT